MDLKITKGEFNILQNELLTSWAQRDKTLLETFTFTDKSKSLLAIQILGAIDWRKLNNLKVYLAARKKFTF